MFIIQPISSSSGEKGRPAYEEMGEKVQHWVLRQVEINQSRCFLLEEK